LIYCYFRKVSETEGEGTSKQRLEEVKEENAKLKEALAKRDEELRILGQHSVVMECEASDASMARERAKAKLGKLFEELTGLRAEHAELQEDNSILKEDLNQLEEKYSSTLEQLSKVQTSLDRALKGRIITEERYKHFHGEYKRTVLKLKEAKAKAADYLHQLSFASRVRDSAWADGLHLGFEMFRSWWKDPSHKVDLGKIHVEDIPCTSETIRRLTNLGREEMPDAAGITVFDYHPPTEDSEATQEDAQDKEAVESDGAAPIAHDPFVVP
jgi:hypothetical protein